MKIKHLLLSLTLSLGLSTTASAGPNLADLTASDYITIGNLDWAYAGPIASQFWFGSSELFQAGIHAGWREATDAEWLTHPDYTAFNGACASQYWNSNFTHCDFGDPLAQHWEAGSTGNFSDLLYVRSEVRSDVPEPATIALLGLGLFGFGVARRRKQ